MAQTIQPVGQRKIMGSVTTEMDQRQGGGLEGGGQWLEPQMAEKTGERRDRRRRVKKREEEERTRKRKEGGQAFKKLKGLNKIPLFNGISPLVKL